MGHTARGGAYESRGNWFARVTVGTKKRKSVLLPGITTEEAAMTRAGAMNALVTSLRAAKRDEFVEKVIEQAAAATADQLTTLHRIVQGICAGTETPDARTSPLPEQPTFRAVFDKWSNGELARDFPDYVDKKRSWRADGYRVKHIPKQAQELPLVAWSVDTYEGVMRGLAADLGSGSRRQVAQLMHRVFELAVYPLRHLTTNPIPRLPKARKDLLLATLYPADLREVAACTDVDIGYRVLWSFLTETGWRISEAVGRKEPAHHGVDESVPPLTWRDVDFAHERAFLARTKTTEAVHAPLDEPTLDGLRAWKAISPKTAPDDPVFCIANGKPITVALAAETFRAHLNMAGTTKVTRPDLFPEAKDAKRRRAVRVHDVRGLFVTASLAEGHSDTWVRERTRHATPSMLDVYRRQVPHFRKYGPITPMVDAVPELAAWHAEHAPEDATSSGSRGGGKGRQNEATEANSLFGRRDSNPNSRNQNPLSCH